MTKDSIVVQVEVAVESVEFGAGVLEGEMPGSKNYRAFFL